jgi:hypothetical protein
MDFDLMKQAIQRRIELSASMLPMKQLVIICTPMMFGQALLPTERLSKIILTRSVALAASFSVSFVDSLCIRLLPILRDETLPL